MKKRHWRDMIKALGSHIDAEEDEQVKKTKIGIHYFSKQPQSLQYYWRLWDCPIENKYTRYKALRRVPLQYHPQQGLFWCALPEHFNPVLVVPESDLENRVAMLMKHIQYKSKTKKGGGPIFDSELIELIDDFHKKYQSLYSLYEHLKGHVLENVCVLEDKDNSPLSSSSSSASSHLSSELEPYISVQRFEELQSKCAQLSECLVEREREIQYLSLETNELGEQNDGLRELVLELENTSKQREEKLSDLLIKLEENEVDLLTKSEDLMEKANDLQEEVDALWSEKDIVYQEGDIVQVISPHKSKSESSLLKVNGESSSFLFQLEILKTKFDRKNKELQTIVDEKKGLENQIKTIISKYAQLEMENEDLNVKVSELEESLMERDQDFFVLEEEFEGLKDSSSARIKALEKEIMNLHMELNNKEKHYQEVISEKDEVIGNLNEEKNQTKTKFYESNLKKLEEASEGIQKKIEESVGNTKLAIGKVIDISARANEIMSGLNYVETKFQECNRQFLNRMSTCSDKVVLAKEVVKGKDKVINEMEGNLDILCGEVGKKEDEIMELKERIWKLENDMIGLGEEKKDAIRQLCVWIDYHRSQNNNLKKILRNLRVFRGRRSN